MWNSKDVDNFNQFYSCLLGRLESFVLGIYNKDIAAQINILVQGFLGDFRRNSYILNSIEIEPIWSDITQSITLVLCPKTIEAEDFIKFVTMGKVNENR